MHAKKFTDQDYMKVKRRICQGGNLMADGIIELLQSDTKYKRQELIDIITSFKKEA